MSLNLVKKGSLKDRFFYQAIELLLQTDDEGESEAKLREMLKENLQARHKAARGPTSSSARSGQRPSRPHFCSLVLLYLKYFSLNKIKKRFKR